MMACSMGVKSRPSILGWEPAPPKKLSTMVWIKANPLQLVSTTGILAQAGGIVLFGAVVFYSWWLARRGLLTGKPASANRPRK